MPRNTARPGLGLNLTPAKLRKFPTVALQAVRLDFVARAEAAFDANDVPNNRMWASAVTQIDAEIARRNTPAGA